MGVASLSATESAPETGASSRYDACWRVIIITLVDEVEFRVAWDGEKLSEDGKREVGCNTRNDIESADKDI